MPLHEFSGPACSGKTTSMIAQCTRLLAADPAAVALYITADDTLDVLYRKCKDDASYRAAADRFHLTRVRNRAEFDATIVALPGSFQIVAVDAADMLGLIVDGAPTRALTDFGLAVHAGGGHLLWSRQAQKLAAVS